MVAMVATQLGEVWQPNKIAIATVAILATLVVVAMLIFMFETRLEPDVRAVPVVLRFSLAVATLRAELKSRYARTELQNKAVVMLKPPSIMKVEEIPLKITASIPPLPIDWQQQIEMSLKSQAQNDSGSGAFKLNRIPILTPLYQALNAPRNPETMRNGDSYRSSTGGVMLKSDGMCSEMRTVQIGPSPSNRTTIAFPGQNCAGDDQSTMAEELSKWANQETKKYPPP
jgi:hypothetical protein